MSFIKLNQLYFLLKELSIALLSKVILLPGPIINNFVPVDGTPLNGLIDTLLSGVLSK